MNPAFRNAAFSFILAFCIIFTFCSTRISAQDIPLLKIETVGDALLNQVIEVSVTTEYAPYQIGGFDFRISFDSTVFEFVEALPGQLLADCEWEQFTVTPDAYGVEFFVIANSLEPGTPLCYGPPDFARYELVKLRLKVTDDPAYAGESSLLEFSWVDCGANAFSSVLGDSLYVDILIYDYDESLIWDESDDDQFPEQDRIPGIGTPDNCFLNQPNRRLAFQNGIVRIYLCGDADGDGSVSITDAVLIVNFAFAGGPAPSPMSTGDVNCDDSVDLSDVVYLVNYAFANGNPPCDTDGDSISDC
jgi:hypothetical protein